MFFEQLANCEEWKNELPQLVMIAVSDAIGEIVNLDTEVLSCTFLTTSLIQSISLICLICLLLDFTDFTDRYLYRSY